MYKIERIQKELLKVFDFTISFLNENHLNWCTCGGTTLGAVRHNGFIPWDDDIDIYMPRKDYNKLLSLKNQLKGSSYAIVDISDDGYYLPYAKLCNTNTTIWEEKRFPFIFGLYVDIFPLDFFNSNNEYIINLQNEYYSLFQNYQKRLHNYSLKDCLWYLKNNRSQFFTSVLPKKIRGKLGKEKALEIFLNAEKELQYNYGDKCVCLTQWIGKIFKTKWFDKLDEVPFENLKVRIPHCYNEYLSVLYGDWKSLPPIEQRITNHNYFYFNLDQRLTIDKILNEYRS